MHLFAILLSFEVSHANGFPAIMYIVGFVQMHLGVSLQRQMLSAGNLLYWGDMHSFMNRLFKKFLKLALPGDSERGPRDSLQDFLTITFFNIPEIHEYVHRVAWGSDLKGDSFDAWG